MTLALGVAASLAHVQQTYERFGRDDPMYAVLSERRFRHNRWDRAEFFGTGRTEIAEALAYVQRLGLMPRRGRVLDFGCGVGRLSQALAEHFQQVVGVDIAQSMVDRARSWNMHGDRVEYRVNARDDLRLFPDESFDFIYSNITLQHIPPEASARYIAEFVRLLRPDGVALFQVPSGPSLQTSAWGRMLYRIRRHHLRRLFKAVRGRHPVEIHYVPREEVLRLVMESGGNLVDIIDVRQHRGAGNFRYCVGKE